MLCRELAAARRINKTEEKSKMRTGKMKKILVLAIVAGVLSAVANSGGGSIYYVPTSTTTVNGDTFCGGAACTSADTIIIRGGARGGLKFQDFDGAGSYITITNETTNPDSKVEITSDGAGGWGVLSLSNCKYVDLRGDNDSDLEYGIKVINDGTPARSGTVWVYGDSDYIKLSYIECAFDGNTTISGIGIQVQDSSLSSSDDFDTFEIHHNYIHNTRYCGMYLGHNNPSAYEDDQPGLKNFSIHDNLFEDMGTYGFNIKGGDGGTFDVYNNTIKRTGIGDGDWLNLTHTFYSGIKIQFFSNGAYADVHDNWFEQTKGAGVLNAAGSGYGGPHNIYNNTIVGCGTGADPDYGHGIVTLFYSTGVEAYDNTIIQANGYGISAKDPADLLASRNLIGDCGSGSVRGINLIEGTCVDVNIYHADVADFGFDVWSDDGDYSNDDFSLRNTLLLQIPQTGWSLLWVDSEEMGDVDRPATNSFDGDPDTFWHTEWSLTDPDPCHPHEIQIDLGGFYDICRFCYLPRQGEYPNGMIKDYEFYVSGDGSDGGSAVASGVFVNDKTEKTVSFDNTLGQYVRLIATSEVNDGPWTSMAELNVLAVQLDTDINNDGKVNIEDFAVLSVWWDNDGGCVWPGWCGGADFNMSGTIDMLDLTYFAENWLRQ
jgi:F5/8 type C domain-containing protein